MRKVSHVEGSRRDQDSGVSDEAKLLGSFPPPTPPLRLDPAVAWFARFIGTTTPSGSSPPFMRTLRPWPLPAGLLPYGAVNDEVSGLGDWVLVHAVSQRASPSAHPRCAPALSRQARKPIFTEKLREMEIGRLLRGEVACFDGIGEESGDGTDSLDGPNNFAQGLLS